MVPRYDTPETRGDEQRLAETFLVGGSLPGETSTAQTPGRRRNQVPCKHSSSTRAALEASPEPLLEFYAAPTPAPLAKGGARGESSQVLLFSEAKGPYAEAVGQTGAQGMVRGYGPHCPPVSRKNPARDEASGAPRAGRGSASFSGLVSGVRVLSPALSGGRPGFRGG